MIDADGFHVIRCKRNFLVPSDLNNAALTDDDLIERSTVFEYHRDYLIAEACLFGVFQVIDKPAGNRN